MGTPHTILTLCTAVVTQTGVSGYVSGMPSARQSVDNTVHYDHAQP